MALTGCKECGSQVSDKAQACPSCGAPIRRKPNTSTQRAGRTWEAAGFIAIVVGLISAIAGQGGSTTDFGIALMVFGFVFFLIGRFK
ncbi:MAG: zinc-ribbon domain-containing protein [Desulfobacteraceae bacterium]|nr:zinc-ribbon domain-containing protein [Desulfobacteraceae bacterium]